MYYEHIIVEGTPYQRGLTHGQKVKEKIQKSLAYYKASKALPPWDICLDWARSVYLPAISYYFPSGLEEIRGISEGSGCTLDEIIILNAQYDLTRIGRNHRYKTNLENLKKSEEIVDKDPAFGNECIGAVVRIEGDIYIGQNWEAHNFLYNNDLIIVLEIHLESSGKILMMTEAGQLCKSGINSNGLGILGMSLWCSDEIYEKDFDQFPNGWLPLTIIRRMFLESQNFSEGLKILLKTPKHVAGNLIIASGIEGHILSIEFTPNYIFQKVLSKDQRFLIQSNHFNTIEFEKYFKETSSKWDLQNSRFMKLKMSTILENQGPYLTEDFLIKAFQDHDEYPNSICAHVDPEDSQMTISCVIYNLSKRYLKICKGTPCVGEFKTIKI